MISEIIFAPISGAPVSALQYPMPSGFPWGMPPDYIPAGYQPQATEAPAITTVMSMPSPMVHTIPYQEEPIFHVAPSESVGVDERMDEF